MARSPRRWPAWLLLAASLPANLGPVLRHAGARAAVATGQESPEVFLTREVPAWGALSFLREHVPVDAPVALWYVPTGQTVHSLDRLASE